MSAQRKSGTHTTSMTELFKKGDKNMNKHNIAVDNSTRGLINAVGESADDGLKTAKKMAVNACRDFIMWHRRYPDEYKGYDDALIDRIKKAKSETEIRDLLRKARAVA